MAKTGPARKPHPSWCGGVKGEKHEPAPKVRPREQEEFDRLGCLRPPEGMPAWWHCHHYLACKKCGKKMADRVDFCPSLQMDVSPR